MLFKRHLLLLTVAVAIGFTSTLRADNTLTLDPFVASDESRGSALLSPRPPYTALRYNEEYAYLADPQKRPDAFDPLKYIPLVTGDRYSYLTLGGEFRERFEYFRNPAFGLQRTHDDFLLQRISLHADVHLNDYARLFVQGISGLEYFEPHHPYSPVEQDVGDLQQAFVDLSTGLHANTSLTVRAGRFVMSYGSGRLIATRAAPNIPLKFDGTGLYWKSGNTKIDAWFVRPDAERAYQFDNENNAQLFWGIYCTTLLGGPLNTNVDLYYLGFRDRNARYADGSGTEERHTVGTRLFGKVNSWDYDVEPVLQFGRLGESDILAWTFGSDVGYTFASTPWTPRVGIKADVASGDTHRGDGSLNSFNPLFFKSGYFNDASFIRPSNIYDLHPSITLAPTSRTQFAVASDVLWRYSQQDAIYGPSGNISLPAGTSGGSYIGTTAETAFQWQVNHHLVWNVSYVHLFASDFVSRAGGGDIDFIGTWLTFTF